MCMSTGLMRRIPRYFYFKITKKVKALLEQIIDAHMKMKLNMIGNQRLNDLNIMANIQVPAVYLSKIVGKNGQILRYMINLTNPDQLKKKWDAL